MRRPTAVRRGSFAALKTGPVVLVQVRDLGEPLLGSFDHRPELEEREGAPVQAAARLAEEDRAPRRELDEKRARARRTEGRRGRGRRRGRRRAARFRRSAAGLRRGRREGQERRPLELVQLDPREDVREEVEDEPRLDAHLLAEQEDVLELRQVAAVDREDDLVDRDRRQDRREVVERPEDREAVRRRPRLRRQGARG